MCRRPQRLVLTALHGQAMAITAFEKRNRQLPRIAALVPRSRIRREPISPPLARYSRNRLGALHGPALPSVFFSLTPALARIGIAYAAAGTCGCGRPAGETSPPPRSEETPRHPLGMQVRHHVGPDPAARMAPQNPWNRAQLGVARLDPNSSKRPEKRLVEPMPGSNTVASHPASCRSRH